MSRLVKAPIEPSVPGLLLLAALLRPSVLPAKIIAPFLTSEYLCTKGMFFSSTKKYCISDALKKVIGYVVLTESKYRSVIQPMTN